MQFLITKDAATKISRECSLEEARAVAAQGFHVQQVQEDGSLAELEPEVSEAAEAEAGEAAPTQKSVPAKKAAKKKGA